jgi:hypothetical protein
VIEVADLDRRYADCSVAFPHNGAGNALVRIQLNEQFGPGLAMQGGGLAEHSAGRDILDPAEILAGVGHQLGHGKDRKQPFLGALVGRARHLGRKRKGGRFERDFFWPHRPCVQFAPNQRLQHRDLHHRSNLRFKLLRIG